MEGNYNIYSNNNNFSLFYKNKQINLNIPEKFFNLKLLHKLFSPEYLSKAITRENAYYLMQFLPIGDSNLICNPQQLSDLLLNTTTKFNTPIKDFYEKYSHRFFTYSYQSKLELFNLENTSDFITKKNIIYIQLKNMLNNIEQNKNNNINNTNETNNINNNINNINPNVIRNTHYNSNDNIITFDMHSELASSGYTSIDFDKDSKHSNSRKNSGNLNGNGNSRERNNITNSNLKENQNQKLGMSINNLSKINQKNKIMSSTNNSFMEHSDDNDSFIDRNIL